MKKPFSIRERLRSFRFAGKGIGVMLKDEHNFRIHLVTAIVVIFLGFYFDVSRSEWLWLILCIGAVLTAETFNSAIEKLVDLKQPDQDPKAGTIKDLAAGAVLIMSICAAIIGAIIFLPYIVK